MKNTVEKKSDKIFYWLINDDVVYICKTPKLASQNRTFAIQKSPFVSMHIASLCMHINGYHLKIRLLKRCTAHKWQHNLMRNHKISSHTRKSFDFLFHVSLLTIFDASCILPSYSQRQNDGYSTVYGCIFCFHLFLVISANGLLWYLSHGYYKMIRFSVPVPVSFWFD